MCTYVTIDNSISECPVKLTYKILEFWNEDQNFWYVFADIFSRSLSFSTSHKEEVYKNKPVALPRRKKIKRMKDKVTEEITYIWEDVPAPPWLNKIRNKAIEEGKFSPWEEEPASFKPVSVSVPKQEQEQEQEKIPF